MRCWRGWNSGCAEKPCVGAAGSDPYTQRFRTSWTMAFIRRPGPISVDTLIHIAALEKNADVSFVSCLASVAGLGGCVVACWPLDTAAIDLHDVVGIVCHSLNPLTKVASGKAFTAGGCRNTAANVPQHCIFFVRGYCEFSEFTMCLSMPRWPRLA